MVDSSHFIVDIGLTFVPVHEKGPCDTALRFRQRNPDRLYQLAGRTQAYISFDKSWYQGYLAISYHDAIDDMAQCFSEISKDRCSMAMGIVRNWYGKSTMF